MYYVLGVSSFYLSLGHVTEKTREFIILWPLSHLDDFYSLFAISLKSEIHMQEWTQHGKKTGCLIPGLHVIPQGADETQDVMFNIFHKSAIDIPTARILSPKLVQQAELLLSRLKRTDCHFLGNHSPTSCGLADLRIFLMCIVRIYCWLINGYIRINQMRRGRISALTYLFTFLIHHMKLYDTYAHCIYDGCCRLPILILWCLAIAVVSNPGQYLLRRGSIDDPMISLVAELWEIHCWNKQVFSFISIIWHCAGLGGTVEWKLW